MKVRREGKDGQKNSGHNTIGMSEKTAFSLSPFGLET
jgi:hypothetical protein